MYVEVAAYKWGGTKVSLNCCFRPDGGRGSPKPDVDSRDLLEERVSTRGSAASPTGAHVADIYLANLNKYVAMSVYSCTDRQWKSVQGQKLTYKQKNK